MLSAVETAFDGIAQTRKRIMIEWANEIWREVENSAILLEQEECDVVSILDILQNSFVFHSKTTVKVD